MHDAVHDGQTLAELAEAQGVHVQTVVDALVVEGEQELADAVAAGRITQERADEIAAALPERVAEMVENGRPERGGPGGRGGADPGERGDSDQGGGATEGSSGTTEGSSTT